MEATNTTSQLKKVMPDKVGALISQYVHRVGPLGNLYVRPSWETTYGKTYRTPTLQASNQYFTKTTK